MAIMRDLLTVLVSVLPEYINLLMLRVEFS